MLTVTQLRDEPLPWAKPWVRVEQQRRIVIVEDDPDTRTVYEAVLGGAGYEVLGAGTGEGGVVATVRTLPDLVICDLRIPDFPGTLVAQTLRGIDETRDIPRIAISGEVESFHPDVLRALFHTVLAKPVERTRLVESVAALIG